MVLRRALLVALALAAILIAGPARAGGVGRPVVERRLANGLRVVVSPDPTGVEVSVLVRYDTGSRDEPGGMEGVAHLLEHVMFLGSRHVAPGAFARLLDQVGATGMNGTTTTDATSYFETVPPERLELALWLESDRMGYGVDRLDEAGLARARAEVLNERRERVNEAGLGAVPGLMFGALFPAWHPYHHLPIGTASAVSGAGVADVRAFFDTWYGPANATLVIAGRVEPSAAMALAERYFGTLPARPPPARPALPPLAGSASINLQVQANVTRQEIRLAWVTPRFGDRGDVELDLAAALLVDRGAGWLEHALLSAPRLSTQVSAAQDSRAMASIFVIRAAVAEGRTVRAVMDGIRAALGRFEQGVSDEEIRRARLVYQHGRLFALESSLGLAQRLASLAQLGPLPPVYDGQVAELTAVTPAAVRHAVRTWLGGNPWVSVVSYPSRGTRPEGEIVAISEGAR
jgi:predicted Zn-dependent peptidase